LGQHAIPSEHREEPITATSNGQQARRASNVIATAQRKPASHQGARQGDRQADGDDRRQHRCQTVKR